MTLKSGVKAFWLGDPKTAKYICVYYHGRTVPFSDRWTRLTHMLRWRLLARW